MNINQKTNNNYNKKIVYNEHIKNVIAVVSGKGGVGKSFITAALANQLEKKGYKVGIIDADITGPSIARSFGLNEKAIGTETQICPVLTKSNIKIISINFMLEDTETPVIWRSSLINSAITQFYEMTDWQDLDFLLIDMPPGTSDVQITVFKNFNLDGLIFVSTPQDLVGEVVQKSLNMAKLMNQKILALVENMSYFVCSECDKKHYIFGDSKLNNILIKNNIKNFVQIPIDSNYSKYIDNGSIEDINIEQIDDLIKIVENKLN